MGKLYGYFWSAMGVEVSINMKQIQPNKMNLHIYANQCFTFYVQGPNGGSNTQYFVGTFDGTTFSSPQIDPLFMDSGVDNYASISFFNEPRGRRVIIGWMTNLMYANDIPTGDWRGQMTMAREVRLAKNSGNALRLRSLVVDEIVEKLVDPNQEISVGITGIAPDTTMYLTDSVPWNNSLMHLNLFIDVGGLCQGCSLSICFLNSKEQEICSGQ